MFEYLLSTSYSGFDYWEYKGIDFKSYFANLKNFISKKDTVLTSEFEDELSKILKQIYDGHIALIGSGYNWAYRHKSVYYCDILVEKRDTSVYEVIDSQIDMVKVGDLFTQKHRDNYLFRTLSATGKYHYLIGVFSFDAVSSRNLSFNDKTIQIPFHKSRLIHAKFDDSKPFYIERKNNIPIVRVTSFADGLYPEMKKFMELGYNLKNEDKIIVNLFYNGGGSSVFPQGFIQNLNGKIQWETHWAILKSPAITEYYAKYDLSSMPNISPEFRNLIVHHKNLYKNYRRSPLKTWEFDFTDKLKQSGSYTGTLILLTNRRVLSAGEGMVGASQSVENRIIIGENTGGSAQFSSTCGYYLPNSKFIAHLPRQLILIPGLEECVGYLPDYWLDTMEPMKEVINWLDDPDNYQFNYSGTYAEMLDKINLSPAFPEDMNITSPGSKVPKTLGEFSGKWYGVWGGILDHILIVEKINDNLEANAIYSWGIAYQWNLNQPGWKRYTGKFEGNMLILTDEDNRIIIKYRLNSDGTLDASYKRPGIFSRTTMTKIND
jgi:hypothetical protein